VSPAQWLCTVSSYFLGIPCIFLQGFSGQGDIGNLLSVSVKSKSCFSKTVAQTSPGTQFLYLVRVCA